MPNMTIVFEISSSKIPKSGIFGSKFRYFFIFHEILQQNKFEGADFKYDNIVFKFRPKSTQIRHFLSQILAFLFFGKTLLIDKFEGVDFKYDNSFFKILAQKYSNKASLVPN